MNKQRLEEMEPGDALCDMHDGLHTGRIKNEEIKTTVITFPAGGGCDFISKQLEGVMYVNKVALLVGPPRYVDKQICAVFAYSYDDRTFGVIEVRAKPCPE